MTRGIKASRNVGALRAGRGCRGHQGASRGFGGVRKHGRWQVAWKPDHVRPQLRIPALPLAGVYGMSGGQWGCQGALGAGRQSRGSGGQ